MSQSMITQTKVKSNQDLLLAVFIVGLLFLLYHTGILGYIVFGMEFILKTF